MINPVGTYDAAMTIISYPNSGTAVHTLPKPAGLAEGDIMIVHHFALNFGIDPAFVPAGWTLLMQYGASQGNVWVYFKRATQSEPGTYQWRTFFSTPPNGFPYVMRSVITTWRGVGSVAGVSSVAEFFSLLSSNYGRSGPAAPNAGLSASIQRAGRVITSFLMDPVVFSPADGSAGFNTLTRGTLIERLNDPPIEMQLATEALVYPDVYSVSAHMGPVSPEPWWSVGIVVLNEPQSSFMSSD